MSDLALSPANFEHLQLKGYRSVDLRSPALFALSFIPGSINLVLDESFEKQAKKFLFRDEALLLVTEPGKEAESVFQLEKLGYQNVRGYLEGGIESWTRDKRPIDVVISILPDEMLIELKHGQLYVYDIRLKSDFNSGHLEESEHVAPKLFIDDYSIIDDDEFSAIICEDGRLSMSLISYLKLNGKHNLYHVTGGFNEIRKYPEIELIKAVKGKR